MGVFKEIPVTAEARLRQIEAITDIAFAHMGVDDLLGELLDRVRMILKVDTAVVLLCDANCDELVATAARGFEEEVRQSVHVPVGVGFAGRIAAERKPVVIEDVRRAELFNPLVVQKGIRSLLGVPLIAGGELLGVLHVGTFTARGFSDEEITFLQLAADRAAPAAQSLLTAVEREAALELQRSLIPPALPELPGIELAARYSPGEARVGGDWYDVFTLPSGQLGVTMGDVAGRGLRAAIIMGRMRSALRAYALETDDPAEVLRRLDRKMQHFEPGALATVLYAVCHPRLDWIRVSSAGHWPPAIVEPGRSTAFIETASDIMIGADFDRPRQSISRRIAPDALLCFYTDGLIERRDRPMDGRLAELCGSLFPGPPEAVCSAVMAALIGREPIDDDVALLTLRRRLVAGGPTQTRGKVPRVPASGV
jgi:phosphoserine phosphatase RsbU/P